MRRSDFINAVSLLFPKNRAFDLTVERDFTRLINGLLSVADSERERIERVYLDYFPDTSRALEEFQKTFRFRFSSEFTEQEIRMALNALVRMRYANSTVESISKVFQEFVPEGLIVENTPVTNAAGLCFAYRSVCGNTNIRCGNERAMCNWHIGNRAWTPTVLKTDAAEGWNLPYNRAWWQLCFFVCYKAFRQEDGKFIAIQRLKVHQKWKTFLEFVLLTLKPIRSVAVMFLEYVPNDEEISYSDDSNGLVSIAE